MACHATRRITAILTIVAVGACVVAHAQSLDPPVAVRRFMGTTQFGMPADAKYIFCDGQDCPERTTKTLPALRQPSSPALAPQGGSAPVPPLPQPMWLSPELSRAKEWVLIEPPARTHRKPPRKKRLVKLAS